MTDYKPGDVISVPAVVLSSCVYAEVQSVSLIDGRVEVYNDPPYLRADRVAALLELEKAAEAIDSFTYSASRPIAELEEAYEDALARCRATREKP